MKSSLDVHIAMFTWLAFGHFIPFLHLSNKLVELGNKISFLIPKGVESKLAKLNRFPNLIHFFPLTIPHVEGLPPGTETLSDIPHSLENHLYTSLDQTRDQVHAILSTILPDFVFFDFAFWVPCLGRELGFKSVMYSIVCAALLYLGAEPSKEMMLGSMKYVEKLQAESFPKLDTYDFGSGITFNERMHIVFAECDALGIRTCSEIEARFVDHLAHNLAMPVLLTGHVLHEKSDAPVNEKWEK